MAIETKPKRLHKKVGRSGAIFLPLKWRREMKLEEGSDVVIEFDKSGIHIRRAALVAVPHAGHGEEGEEYTPERMAQFLLSSAIDKEDYADACREVRRLGLDPANIDHIRPKDAAL